MTDLLRAARYAKEVLDYVDRFLNMNKAIRYELVRDAIADLDKALAQPEQKKESTAQTVDPRLLLGRSNNFTKETENRLCDIERRLAVIETQPALAQPEQDNIQYVFPDKPVEALKDCEPKEVWIYVKGEWLKFKKEQA